MPIGARVVSRPGSGQRPTLQLLVSLSGPFPGTSRTLFSFPSMQNQSGDATQVLPRRGAGSGLVLRALWAAAPRLGPASGGRG